MSRPQLIIGADVSGRHNFDDQASLERLERAAQYRDCSTVIVIPTRGCIPPRVVESWWNLMMPMNHPTVRVFAQGMEVGEAYDTTVKTILSHPQLSRFRYMLTLEEDNMPPPDGLLKLIESIPDHAAVGGLYWTKGELGQPMIYGKPGELPMFPPQKPETDTLQECNGLGMGFTLFDLAMLKEIKEPRFKTMQVWEPGGSASMATQDLYAFERIRSAGYKVACDTRVRVGHYDAESGIVW